MSKITGYIGGIILILVGFFSIIFGFSKFLSAGNAITEGTMQSLSSGVIGIIFIFVGGIAAVIGCYIIYFTSLGKINPEVIKETAPVITTISKDKSYELEPKKLESIKKPFIKKKKSTKAKAKKTKAKL